MVDGAVGQARGVHVLSYTFPGSKSSNDPDIFVGLGIELLGLVVDIELDILPLLSACVFN